MLATTTIPDLKDSNSLEVGLELGQVDRAISLSELSLIKKLGLQAGLRPEIF